MHRSRSQLALALSVVAILAGSTWFARAQLGGSEGVTIPYSGHLELAGEPVDGAVTFTVHVYPDATSAACFTQPGLVTQVKGGSFAFVVTGVPEACVVDREVHLGIEIDQGNGAVALGGRQPIHPALAALTSGAGDFSVTGNVQVSEGTGPSLVLGVVGHGGDYLGIGREGIADAGSYALIQSNDGETFVNSALSRSLHLRTGNIDRAVVHAGGLSVTGSLSATAAGGNVPHACVIRSVTGTYNAACASGEIAVGGGGRCNNLYRLTESLPWGGPLDSDEPVNGQPARAWRSVCQVWGEAGFYAPPQLGAYAVCCRQ